MSARTLVTGFGPFLNVTENPSSNIAQRLGRPYAILDVSYEAVERFLTTVDVHSFDRLLLLGVAVGRTHVCPELFARNTYGSTADVSGRIRAGAIAPDQPLLLESTLFTAESLATALASEPALRLSLDAGSYLCNFTLFSALMAFPEKRVGFAHLTAFEKLAAETQIQAISAVLNAVER